MRNDAVHTETYRGYGIEIHHDDYRESPREWDNLGTMVCWHRRYNIGDEHSFSDPEEFRQWARENDAYYWVLWLYDHGIQSISMQSFYGRAHHAEWDSGRVGYIYVTKEAIRKEFGVKRITKKLLERVEKIIQGEVERYDQYMRGAVYGYRVLELDEYGEEVDCVDSCWGYYGNYDGDVLSEARSVVDWQHKRALKSHIEQLKAWIKNGVGIEHRTPCPANAV